MSMLNAKLEWDFKTKVILTGFCSAPLGCLVNCRVLVCSLQTEPISGKNLSVVGHIVSAKAKSKTEVENKASFITCGLFPHWRSTRFSIHSCSQMLLVKTNTSHGPKAACGLQSRFHSFCSEA